MKQFLASVLIVAVIGGLVAAFAFLWRDSLGEDSADKAAARAAPEPEKVPLVDTTGAEKKIFPLTGNNDLGKRLSLLEDDLGKRIREIELKDASQDEEIKRLKQSLAGARKSAGAEGGKTPSGEGSSTESAAVVTPEMKEEILTIMREERTSRDKEFREKRRGQMAKRVDRQIGDIAKRLEWTGETAARVREILAERMKRLRELRKSARSGGMEGREGELREQARRIIEETTGELKELVGEDGVQALGHVLNPRGPRGGPPRDGPPGGGGGPRPPR